MSGGAARNMMSRIAAPEFNAPVKSAVARVLERERRRWADVEENEPSSADLAEVQSAVLRLWNTEHALEGLPRQQLRWLPWVTFRQVPPQGVPCGLLPGFAAAVCDLLAIGRPRQLKTFIHTFLRDYPEEQGSLEKWARGLRKLVSASDALSLKPWQERCDRYAVLDGDGARKLAARLFNPQERPDELLDEAGVSGELLTGGFMRVVHRELLGLADLERALKRGELKAVERLRCLMEQSSDTLVFPELKANLAEALLKPFLTVTPEEGMRDAVKACLLKHLKDPRTSPGNWRNVDDACRGVMRRWLAARDMTFFFDHIGDQANNFQWAHRRKFWECYLQRNAVEDVWLILGAEAYERLSVRHREMAMGCGRIDDGSQGNKCALMMRIGDITFLEWSEDGACRVWNPDDTEDYSPQAPAMFKARYPRAVLMKSMPAMWNHIGSEYGVWQARFEKYIARYTGIKLKVKDYMV